MKNWNYIFKFEDWIDDHKPKNKQNSDFWDEVNLEFEEVKAEFKNLLSTTEDITDKDGNKLAPINLYNLIDQYAIYFGKYFYIINVLFILINLILFIYLKCLHLNLLLI